MKLKFVMLAGLLAATGVVGASETAEPTLDVTDKGGTRAFGRWIGCAVASTVSGMEVAESKPRDNSGNCTSITKFEADLIGVGERLFCF